MTKPQTHDFTVLVRGADLLEDDNLEALFEAGCDDATFGEEHGASYAAFHREADTFADAVITAIEAIERAVPGALVYRVQGDELVTASAIAERMGRSRESVRLLIEGKRGPGGFPPPVPWVRGKTRLWEWADVARWFNEALSEEPAVTEPAAFIAALNGALEVRQRAPELSDPAERAAVAAFLRQDSDALAAVS
jgi:hypothetical protein